MENKLLYWSLTLSLIGFWPCHVHTKNHFVFQIDRNDDTEIVSVDGVMRWARGEIKIQREIKLIINSNFCLFFFSTPPNKIHSVLRVTLYCDLDTSMPTSITHLNNNNIVRGFFSSRSLAHFRHAPSTVPLNEHGSTIHELRFPTHKPVRCERVFLFETSAPKKKKKKTMLAAVIILFNFFFPLQPDRRHCNDLIWYYYLLLVAGF
jgi:hypothetical protein